MYVVLTALSPRSCPVRRWGLKQSLDRRLACFTGRTLNVSQRGHHTYLYHRSHGNMRMEHQSRFRLLTLVNTLAVPVPTRAASLSDAIASLGEHTVTIRPNNLESAWTVSACLLEGRRQEQLASIFPPRTVRAAYRTACITCDRAS